MNTNFKQSSAYELAEIIEDDMEEGFGMGFLKDAVAMLRQQADRIAKLEKDLHMTERHYERLHTQKKPLSDEEIMEIKTLMEINYGCVPPLEFAWAIEERHGIK